MGADTTPIGGPISLDPVAATLLDHEDHQLSDHEKDALWEIFVEIGRCWGNAREDSLNLRSSWLEFINAKTEQPPSYAGEYANAGLVVQELIEIYGRNHAFTLLFLRNGIPDGPPTTRVAHVKRYVVDEFIRVQVVAGGFKGLVKPSPVNYRGWVGGSRYNRLPRVRAYEPAASKDGSR